MAMQPSQKAFEDAKAALASLGASVDASRHLSLSAPNAIKQDVAQALKSSMLDRESYFSNVGQTRAAAGLAEAGAGEVVRAGKGLDNMWGSVDVVRMDVKSYMEAWHGSDPAGFKKFESQVEGLVKDQAALRKISPASADVIGDMVIFGNAKCSDVVKQAVALKIKTTSPEAPQAFATAKPKA